LAAFLEETQRLFVSFFSRCSRKCFLLGASKANTPKEGSMPRQFSFGLPPDWGAQTTNHDGAGGRNHAYF
jgi:hypothetical protein